jgi:hypothetical protein
MYREVLNIITIHLPLPHSFHLREHSHPCRPHPLRPPTTTAISTDSSFEAIDDTGDTAAITPHPCCSGLPRLSSVSVRHPHHPHLRPSVARLPHRSRHIGREAVVTTASVTVVRGASTVVIIGSEVVVTAATDCYD